jgi:hypothetical protein
VAGVNSGTDTIAFDIPDGDANYGHNTSGVWTIVLASTLYSAGDDIVDGTTQATNYGSDTNAYGPEIEISGESQTLGATMWSMNNNNNTIKGLAINRGHGYAIYVLGGDDNTIIGNYIGSDATGSANVSSAYDGILLGNGAQNNNIGGPSESERNVISGFEWCGIRIFAAATTVNVIGGNYIGTDRTGTAPLGNGCGIKIHADAYDNTIGPNNVIAHNNTYGVMVDGSGTYSNTLTQNSIHTNGSRGIALTNAGNDSVAAPSISSHTCASASGTAPISAAVELFTGPDDEGKTYLTSVSADGSGNWSASGFWADDMFLTATATDIDGNTSEFSAVAGCGHRGYVPLATKSH